MFVVKKFIHVSDTDFTKALYFTSLLRFIQEAFESLLRDKYIEVYNLLLKEEVGFPIVHVDADFLSPISIGQEIEIQITLEPGNTSLLVSGKVFHDGILKGKGQIKQVCVNLKLQKKLACKELFPAF